MGHHFLRTVMVIPSLSSHNHWCSKQSGYSSKNGPICRGQFFAQPFTNGQYTQPDPYGKGIERTGIGIIPFTWFKWLLIEIQYYGNPCKEEQQRYDSSIFLVALKVPNRTDQSYDQW